jgi:hypothetical protein
MPRTKEQQKIHRYYKQVANAKQSFELLDYGIDFNHLYNMDSAKLAELSKAINDISKLVGKKIQPCDDYKAKDNETINSFLKKYKTAATKTENIVQDMTKEQIDADIKYCKLYHPAGLAKYGIAISEEPMPEPRSDDETDEEEEKKLIEEHMKKHKKARDEWSKQCTHVDAVIRQKMTQEERRAKKAYQAILKTVCDDEKEFAETVSLRETEIKPKVYIEEGDEKLLFEHRKEEGRKRAKKAMKKKRDKLAKENKQAGLNEIAKKYGVKPIQVNDPDDVEPVREQEPADNWHNEPTKYDSDASDDEEPPVQGDLKGQPVPKSHPIDFEDFAV